MEYAKDKVMMGTERRSMIISDKEKKITAYHEAGHALVASVEKEADPLHKVSIIPRGMALGVTQQLPLNDKYTYSRPYLEAQLTVLLGGRVAEEIFLKEQTSGAGNDLERATSIARKMVCEWGMSELGTVVYSKKDDMIFLGKDMMSHSEYSEDTARKIDIEIKSIIDIAYKKTEKIIIDNRDSLEKIAQLLLEKESLSSKEIDKILGKNNDSDKSDEENDVKKVKKVSKARKTKKKNDVV
jgi:cell division protease FtsH